MGAIPEGQPHAGEYIWFTVNDGKGNTLTYDANCLDAGLSWLAGLNDIFTNDWMEKQAGWTLSGKDEWTFWYLQAVNVLTDGAFDYKAMDKANITVSDQKVKGGEIESSRDECFEPQRGLGWHGFYRTGVIHWSPYAQWEPGDPWLSALAAPGWWSIDGGDTVAILGHELQHAKDWLGGMSRKQLASPNNGELNAINVQNTIITALYKLLNFA